MININKNIGLYTDHYELTMAQGYFLSGMDKKKASFDYFFRKNPFHGGFVVFAGLLDLMEFIEGFVYREEDCRYLESIGFDKKFVQYLEGFKFSGDILSVQEGEIVFPNEPIIRVEGNIVETQLIESLLLNSINFQSLIATKAARMRLVAGERQLVDFGLRRAQGLGSIHASRAAMIGGFNSTSNVYSAYRYGYESTGPMAHSWIQAFNDEISAFRAFAKLYPSSSILLVDTYDTIKSGIPNAIKIARELEENGGKLQGIRLDSGDLASLSKTAREMLDEEGLEYVKIVVSNQLDEFLIRSLIEQKAPIDAFGVGTSLVVGREDGALDGVYKLAEIGDKPTMKFSENIAKTTLPGKKNIYRFTDPGTNEFLMDGIELEGYKINKLFSIQGVKKEYLTQDFNAEELMKEAMKNGKRVISKSSVYDIAKYGQLRLSQLKDETKRFENPHTYVLGIGNELKNLQEKLKEEL